MGRLVVGRPAFSFSQHTEGNLMPQNWTSRFSDNIRDYGGYAIGKLFKLLNDPEIISLAGGLPSPDTFLTNDLQRVSQIRLQEDADTIMQYTDITGEMNLIEAVIQFLRKDRIDSGFCPRCSVFQKIERKTGRSPDDRHRPPAVMSELSNLKPAHARFPWPLKIR